MSVGIKETQELIAGIGAVAVALIGAVKKDGVGKGALDLVELFFQDAEFKAKVVAAVEQVNAIPAEIGDLDFAEGFELGKDGIELVKVILNAVQAA